jgi:hypothetical protein
MQPLAAWTGSFLPTVMRRSGSRFPGRRFFLEPFEDLAGRNDQVVRAVQHLPVNNLVDPMAALARAKAQLTLPRGCEEEAVPVEAPAAEYASHFQPVHGRKRILGVDADLVLNLAHSGRLAPSSEDLTAKSALVCSTGPGLRSLDRSGLRSVAVHLFPPEGKLDAALHVPGLLYRQVNGGSA